MGPQVVIHDAATRGATDSHAIYLANYEWHIWHCEHIAIVCQEWKRCLQSNRVLIESGSNGGLKAWYETFKCLPHLILSTAPDSL